MIVGIIGGPNAGKSTCAKFMMKHGDFISMGFADPIRRFLFQLFPECEDQLFGSSKHREEDIAPGVPARALMERIGKLVRDVKGKAFIECALTTAQLALANSVATGVVFHDTRGTAETDAIRAAGGRVIRLTRGGACRTPTGEFVQEPDDLLINNESMTLVEFELATIRTMGMLGRSEPKG